MFLFYFFSAIPTFKKYIPMLLFFPLDVVLKRSRGFFVNIGRQFPINKVVETTDNFFEFYI